jgi:hypothetical protein
MRLSGAIALIMVVSLTTTAEASSSHSVLRNNPADVMITYARIASASPAERRNLFVEASPSMKADLWLIHLENFVTDHDDLTPGQRSVIFEAVGMVASGLFEEPDPGRLSERFAKPFELMQAHARAEFPKALLIAAFATLGPTNNTAPKPSRPGLLPRVNGLPLEPPECGCHWANDFCDSITNPDHTCILWGYNCKETNSGCGWLYYQSCDGFCE